MKEKQRDMKNSENIQPTSNQEFQEDTLENNGKKIFHEIMTENTEYTTPKIQEGQ